MKGLSFRDYTNDCYSVCVRVHATQSVICNSLQNSDTAITAGHSYHAQMKRGILFSHTHQTTDVGIGLDRPDATKVVSDAHPQTRETPLGGRGRCIFPPHGEVSGTPDLDQPPTNSQHSIHRVGL